MSSNQEPGRRLRGAAWASMIGLLLSGASACGGDPVSKAADPSTSDQTPDDSDNGGDTQTNTGGGKDAGKPPAPVLDAGHSTPVVPDAGVKAVVDASKPVDAQTDAAAPSSTTDAATTSPTSSGPTHIVGPDPTAASASGAAKGPFETANFTSGYKDMPGFLNGTIWYPKGDDAKPPFGCITVVPGFTAQESSIRTWGPFLASHGIVTFTIMTNSPSDDPPTRSTALLDALESCKAENERADSPLKGKIDKDRLGVSGWSMGGGGTLIAAGKTPSLKAGVSFAAYGPTGGMMDKVPVLMFEATADPLAANMSDGYYAAIADSVPKMLFEVEGAGHDVANSPSNQMGTIGLYGLSWFKVFLEGDERYKQFLTAPKPSIATAKFKTNVK